MKAPVTGQAFLMSRLAPVFLIRTLCSATMLLVACSTTPAPTESHATERTPARELGEALADERGPYTFCNLNPEGCAGTNEPAAQDKETCKAICWERYDHNKQFCEELRHEPAAYRRCVISAGLLLSGCLATCEALSSVTAETSPRANR